MKESTRITSAWAQAPAPHHRPGGRKGTTSATPLVVLAHLMSHTIATSAGDRCVVCERRKGKPRRIAPDDPTLAAMVPPGPKPASVVCRRCFRSPAVRCLISQFDAKG